MTCGTPPALQHAFEGVDVVGCIWRSSSPGASSSAAARSINVDGMLNVLGAAAAGASRFVYASSVAAYGFHRDNPVVMTEQWPT